MNTLTPATRGRKPSDTPVPAATSALLELLRSLPAPLAELRDPASQAALATATRRGAIKLLLSSGAVFVVRSR
jgi:hypothetical protein